MNSTISLLQKLLGIKIFLVLLCVCSVSLAYAQTKFTIAGFVKDKTTGEALIGANVVVVNSTNGCFTDERGFFSLKASMPANIECSYIGYASATIACNTKKDTLVIVHLYTANNLETVVVQAPYEQKSNVVSLQKAELMQIPALGGKPDVLKTAQMLPGIQAQTEGSSLLVVRGGDPGQNLYLIDNVPLIYVNHLGGFTSVFNPDMINSIDIYKGSFPSQYGGKLSSIMNITQRDGDNSKLKGSIGVGVSDISFTVEGPTKISNTSFIVTGRKTVLPDVLMYTASSLIDGNNTKVSYGFHDINAKFTWKPNLSNSVSVNVYQGDDYMNFWGKESDQKFRLNNTWGNNLVAIHWAKIINPKLRVTHIASYTRFRTYDKLRYSFPRDTVKEFITKNESSKQEISLQSLWKYNAFDFWKINFGLQTTFESFKPSDTYNSSLSYQKPYSKITGNESSLYLENTITLNKFLVFVPGVRYHVSVFDSYSNNAWEPRLQLKLTIGTLHSLSLDYMQVYQTSHLLFTQGTIMSNEVWIPSGNSILPAHSTQYSASWNSSLFSKTYTVQCNVYLKEMDNLVNFKQGYTSIKGDEQWQSKMATGGKGTSQGIEFFVRKQSGNWRGFAGYSYSHTNRSFPDIDNGKIYIYEYDRPHSFSLTAMRKISEKWSFAASWTYQTGLPYTPVIGRQRSLSSELDFDGNPLYYDAFIYGATNSARMNDYHRLDLGFTYKGHNKYNQRCEWNFSVYNAYNRKNPIYYYYNYKNSSELYYTWSEQDFGYKPMKMYKISLFPIIPTVAYKVYLEGEQYKMRKQKSKESNKTITEKFKAWMFYEN